MRFGLLLPHFGKGANAERILAGSQRAEEMGFSSVWVRDHLIFDENKDGTSAPADFLDALTVLTAVGMTTKGLRLGTGALVPLRHPLSLARMISTMSQFVGRQRLVLGIGAGHVDREFQSLGIGGYKGVDLALANIEILRRLWAGESVTWTEEPYRFSDIGMEPPPAGGSVPLLYCGSTPRAARIAGSVCDGWMPGRLPLATLRKRLDSLYQCAEEAGRPAPAVGLIPTTSVATTRERARARLDAEAMVAAANRARFWVKPPSGSFTSLDDLAGMVLAGTPDDIGEQVTSLGESGVHEVVFDFRASFDEWEDQVAILAAEVLPAFR